MAFLVAISLLVTASICNTASSSSNPFLNHPNFQHLNVKETIFTSKNPNPKNKSESLNAEKQLLSEEETPGKWKLDLLHRDDMHDHHHHHHPRKAFEDRMKRDSRRVKSVIRRTSNGGGGKAYRVSSAEEFGSEVVSGMEQGSGEYFVRIGVGSPARSQYVVVDSGSDIVWVQCRPCTSCYRQSDPLFDPAASATFSGVPCSSAVCGRLDAGSGAACRAGRCRYEVSYGDGSFTRGTLALETLTLGRAVINNVAIGCGHTNQGMFVGAAGLLGLGGGAMSFVGQLGGQTGGAFSYCLLTRGSGSPGSLEFGQGALPVGAAWVPLVRNPRAASFYYVGLVGLGVGGGRVAVADDAFLLTESGEGGVVMDTGTAVTRLPTQAYAALRDAFAAQTTSLPRAPPVSIFDTCYDLSGFVSVRVPTVSFYLAGGPVLTLPAKNFLIPVDDVGTFCFAFSASPSGLSIIGNVQQQGIQISFDAANGFVGFGPNVC